MTRREDLRRIILALISHAGASMTHKYGLAVRCKKNIDLAALDLASMNQASDWSTLLARQNLP